MPRLFRPDPDRMRRALFRLATDAPLLGAFLGTGIRWGRLTVGLLGLRARCALGHPDSATLGRTAAWWHAARVLPATRRILVEFRFQDRLPSARLQIQGGFSLARFLAFLMASFAAFPWFRLWGRAWHAWRHANLEGWRAFAYARIRKVF
jgi:hypothetical protein